ncbi:MAG: hypothetical protein KDA89_12295 [Planctomycetaceae bacterium]|nr:hypothetical protein [Planctomycetaceae bacterium]
MPIVPELRLLPASKTAACVDGTMLTRSTIQRSTPSPQYDPNVANPGRLVIRMRAYMMMRVSLSICVDGKVHRGKGEKSGCQTGVAGFQVAGRSRSESVAEVLPECVGTAQQK